MFLENDKLMHIYGMGFPHEGYNILLNENAIDSLIEALKKLKTEKAVVAEEFFANDGEGYEITLIKVNMNEFEKLSVPYNEEPFIERDEYKIDFTGKFIVKMH